MKHWNKEIAKETNPSEQLSDLLPSADNARELSNKLNAKIVEAYLRAIADAISDAASHGQFEVLLNCSELSVEQRRQVIAAVQIKGYRIQVTDDDMQISWSEGNRYE